MFASGNFDDLDYGTISGTITDINGNSILNAGITATNTDTSVKYQTITDRNGYYSVSKLKPGIYILHIKATGFQTIRYQQISIFAGKQITINARLNPDTIQESITIVSQDDDFKIDTSKTTTGGTITKTAIDNLPIESRDALDLVYLLPGASLPGLTDKYLAEGDKKDRFNKPPEEAGVFSLGGGTPFSNNITLESMDNNDDRSARERFTPSINAIEEVQVIVNQYSAEYGRASGGRVNFRLRSGSDKIRGNGFYYFRDESLNANPFMRNVEHKSRIPFQNQNAGISIGAPIIRQRLHIFSAYEHDYIYDQTDITALLPMEINPTFPLPIPNGIDLGFTTFDKSGKSKTINGGAGVGLYDERITTPSKRHSFQTKTDFNHNSRNNLFSVFTFARERDERSFTGGRRTLDTIRNTGRNSYSISLHDNYLISPNINNNAEIQYSKLSPSDAPLSNSPVVLIDIDDPRDYPGSFFAPELLRGGKLTTGASTLSGTDRKEHRIQLKNNITYTQPRFTIRTGFDFQYIKSKFIDLADTTGTFTFADPTAFLTNRPDRYQHRFNTSATVRNRYAGTYLQTDVRLKAGLNLGLGIRWDNESAVPDRNNIGARISTAWAPFKSGKTVMRAGYGIFYNRALLRTLHDYILTFNSTIIDTNIESSKYLLSKLQFPNTIESYCKIEHCVPQFESSFMRKLSDGFRIPESYQASLGIEHELTKRIKIEISYVFNRGAHLWRETNINAPILPQGFENFTQYLLSRDFGDTRFVLNDTSKRTIKEGKREITEYGLLNSSTSNATGVMKAALLAVQPLRAYPELTQIEELQSRGNSYYHGMSVELQTRFASKGFIRGSYTLSKLIDDGVVNTSSALNAGDFASERALSLMDSRHRIAISWRYISPSFLARIAISGVFNISSSRPFNIGINGNDRNLDDVGTDRPVISGVLNEIEWQKPEQNQSLKELFSLPAIGSPGNLQRNAGRGPIIKTLNLRLSREFRIYESRSIQLNLEAFNPMNQTVFSFGSEYVNYNSLVPKRTMKPRTLRLGIKFDF